MPPTAPGSAPAPTTHDRHRLTAPRIPGLITAMGRTRLPDGTDPPAAEDTWRAVLSQAELRRAGTFRLDADRHQFQYTRWMLRTELSRLAPVAPRDWEFVLSPNGKPALHPRYALDIEFSLSHSAGICLIALTRGRPVGIDIQTCDALAAPDSVRRLVARCLSPEERAAVEHLPHPQRRDAVTQLWTLKEAYAKAVGLGLRLPFARIAFAADGHAGITLRRTTHVPAPDHWHCHAPQAPTGFRIGVCAARPDPSRREQGEPGEPGESGEDAPSAARITARRAMPR
ncbi:4'-phosphopantetheinyl transferase family protein [Streptomyces sp. NPDC059477]|uniref:4'-phosphopantetheinyl transferase family protein n=1 Tax=Streptomyces sp. NPDC059477 TaxID=3346847 RepID=UPI00369FD39D